MKKYFIIVFWKALEVTYKSFFWEEIVLTLYICKEKIIDLISKLFGKMFYIPFWAQSESSLSTQISLCF